MKHTSTEMMIRSKWTYNLLGLFLDQGWILASERIEQHSKKSDDGAAQFKEEEEEEKGGGGGT
jgi:hypothetical protein